MQHLADLLATIPLPADENEGSSLTRLPQDGIGLGGIGPDCAGGLVHDLGADLPAGHLHVWGGPSGAGKTSFLLSLLHAAASSGRRVAYATYDLAPESLALRMLAMASNVELDALPDPGSTPAVAEAQSKLTPTLTPTLTPAEACRARAARAALSRLPFSFLPARGFSVESISDRLVRMPFRAEVLAVDYLQGVIRQPGTDLGVALRSLSDMASHLHVAVVCAVRPQEAPLEGVHPMRTDAASRGELATSEIPDRVGWIQPRADGARRKAEVVRNRHGDSLAVRLDLDQATGGLGRAPSDGAGAGAGA